MNSDLENDTITSDATTTTLRENYRIITINKTVTRINEFNKTNIVTVNKTNIINETKIIEEYMNITDIQKNLLLNLKPESCFNIGCSQGYHLCKEDVFDILEFKKPKFRELPSRGYDPFFSSDDNDSQVTFNIIKDYYGDFVNLSGSYWYVTGNYIYNVTELYDYNRNKSFIFNRTFEFRGNDLKLRRLPK